MLDHCKVYLRAATSQESAPKAIHVCIHHFWGTCPAPALTSLPAAHLDESVWNSAKLAERYLLTTCRLHQIVPAQGTLKHDSIKTLTGDFKAAHSGALAELATPLVTGQAAMHRGLPEFLAFLEQYVPTVCPGAWPCQPTARNCLATLLCSAGARRGDAAPAEAQRR